MRGEGILSIWAWPVHARRLELRLLLLPITQPCCHQGARAVAVLPLACRRIPTCREVRAHVLTVTDGGPLKYG